MNYPLLRLTLTSDVSSSSSGSSSNSVSSMSTLHSNFSSSTCESSYDNTEWEISQPDTFKNITRYTLKRTIFVYGIDKNITKNKIIRIFSRFGTISNIISTNERHHILGTPNVEHARKLTSKYVSKINPQETTCFFIIFKTKGGFKKCAQKALNNPNFNIFKMDKRLKDFGLKCLS